MDESYRRIGSIAAKVYAALVLLCGLAFLVLAFLLFGAVHVGEAAPYVLVPGLVFAALSVFIWRGATWAMILMAALALGFVFGARGDPNFVALLAVPAVFAALTAICIRCRAKSSAA